MLAVRLLAATTADRGYPSPAWSSEMHTFPGASAGFSVGPGGVLLSSEGRPVPHGVTLGSDGVLIAANGRPLPPNIRIGPNGYVRALQRPMTADRPIKLNWHAVAVQEDCGCPTACGG